jgi:hypothetical protein
MENQEEKKTEQNIVNPKPEDTITHPEDYRITGNDSFILCVGSAIVSGPSISDGDKVIKQFLRDVAKTNREKNAKFVRAYPPIGYQIPQEWWDDIKKNLQ